MHNLNFYVLTKVLFGSGRLNELHMENLPAKVHEVLSGDITADLWALSDEDYLTIYENVYK